MKVKICDKCKTKDVINELKKINGLDLEIGCINFCGVARNKYVAIINNKPIIENDKKIFLDKIKEEIN